MSNKFSRLQKALSADELSSRFQAELERLWQRPVVIDDFAVVRVFPGVDGSFTMQFRMSMSSSVDNSSPTLILGGLLLADTDSVPSFISENSNDSFFLDDLRLAVPIFPFDPELKNLRSVYESPWNLEAFKQFFSQLSPGTIDSKENWHTKILAYRMGKRCVFAVSSGLREDRAKTTSNTEFILKLLRPKKMNRATGALRFLAENGFSPESKDGINAPALLSADGTESVLITSKSSGSSLHDLTGESTFADSCARAGQTIKKLHNLSGDSFPEFSFESHLAELRWKVVQAGEIFPEYRSLFYDAWSMVDICRTVLREPVEPKCIHTDFYDKQLIIGSESVTLLDTDSLSCGDPAMDIGNFIAHLYLRSLQNPDLCANIQKGIETFQSEFEMRTEQEWTRIRYWEAATLLRLAVLYSLRPKWHKLTGTILKRVIECLSNDSANQTVGRRG